MSGEIIKVKHKGSFKNTERFMEHALRRNYRDILDSYGQKGVDALANATPKDTGKTSQSWSYGISEEKGKIKLYWSNSSENRGISIVLLLIYGHGLQNGSYIQGVDFVSPAIRPIFNEIVNKSWKEVIR